MPQDQGSLRYDQTDKLMFSLIDQTVRRPACLNKLY